MQEYKLIVAGGRDFDDYAQLEQRLLAMSNEDSLGDIAISLVSGMARGADNLGVRFAHEYGVKLYTFPANWDKHGKAAGFRRNEEMGQFADGLLAFWDGQSRGTKHMIDYMRFLNKEVKVVSY